MSRYASPVTDILYYYACCTVKEFRQKYFGKLLRVYHDSLTAALKRLAMSASVHFVLISFEKNLFNFSFGSNPEKLFPFEALQQQLRTFGIFGISVGALMLPMLTSDSNDCAKLEEIAEQMQSGETTDVFENTSKATQLRLRDLIVDLDQFGCL